MIVVIPSIRGVVLDHLEPLIDHGARFIVVDDTEGSITIDHPLFEVHNWSDRRTRLGVSDVAIPRGNGACRDYGFYLAWQEGDPGEVIVALDDDCVVTDGKFPNLVEAVLSPAPRPVVAGSGRHFNVFDLYEDVDGRTVFPRGFPYSARLRYEPWGVGGEQEVEPVFNLGLWKGAFDINAIDKYHLEQTVFPDAALRYPNVVVPPGALVSVCSGSMQFRREVIPAVYQLPMRVPIMGDWVMDRYGDIWAGFILKTFIDLRGDVMTVGGPLVVHEREAPFEVNVAREHLGHLVGEEFVELIVEIGEEIAPGGYLEMMEEVTERLASRVEMASPVLRSYLGHLVDCMDAWTTALG